MRSLEPSPPRRPVYLDRPQRLGILPHFEFWNQPEVWRLVGPFMGVMMAAWVLTLGVLLSGVVSPITLGLLGAGGGVLLLGLIERFVRRRMRQRALGAGSGSSGP